MSDQNLTTEYTSIDKALADSQKISQEMFVILNKDKLDDTVDITNTNTNSNTNTDDKNNLDSFLHLPNHSLDDVLPLPLDKLPRKDLRATLKDINVKNPIKMFATIQSMIQTTKDKSKNFKFLISNFISKTDPRIVKDTGIEKEHNIDEDTFKPNKSNTGKFLYLAGLNIGKSVKNTQEVISKLNENVSLFNLGISSFYSSLDEKIYLLGKKRILSQNKYTIHEVLEELGINEKILIDDKENINIDKKDLKHALKSHMSKFHSIFDSSLSNLDDHHSPLSIKKDLIKNIAQPYLKKTLQESFSLIIVSERLLSSNKDYKAVDSYLEANNISMDTLCFLMDKPKLLLELKGVETILPNLEGFSKIYNKYNSIINSNLFIIKHHISLSSKVYNAILPKNEVNDLFNEQFLNIYGKNLSINDFKNQFNTYQSKYIDNLDMNKILEYRNQNIIGTNIKNKPSM